MAIKQREYLFSTNEFNEPAKLEGKPAIGILLARLIMMDPGTDPLHPTMGVGIRNYRHRFNNGDELRRNVQNQIETFLPCYQNATVAIIITPDKLCNIEITINDVIYTYDSHSAPIPITLSDVENN